VTYNGFSGASPPPRSEAARPAHKRGPSRALLLGGVAAALGLGLIFGVLARPELVTGDAPAAAPQVSTPTAADLPAADPQLAVEVAPPAAAPDAAADVGPLPVLRPEARTPAAPPPAAAPAPSPRFEAATPAPRAAPSPPVARPATPAPTAPAPAQAPAYAQDDGPRPSFDCRYARSRSERMVCSDDRLAAADRRLARAYERAVAAGVPPRELRADQDDWLSIREDAARYGRGAVGNVYEQRIQELEDMAD